MIHLSAKLACQHAKASRDICSTAEKYLQRFVCVCLCACVCLRVWTLLCIAFTWLTLSSISATATFFFFSGLSFQYIIMAAFRTASSNLLSADNLRTSASFSGVIPVSSRTEIDRYEWQTQTHKHCRSIDQIAEPFSWIQQRWSNLAALFLPCLAALISQSTARRLFSSLSISSARIK